LDCSKPVHGFRGALGSPPKVGYSDAQKQVRAAHPVKPLEERI